MFSHSLAAFLIVLSLYCVPRFPAQSVPALPPGPMKQLATTACTECHESRIILQQRLSKAAWTKEVDKMIKWGALVDPKDRDELIDYLSENCSVDKPSYAVDRLAASGAKQK